MTEKRQTLVIVDDELEMLYVLEEVLKNQPVKIRTFSDSMLALNYLKTQGAQVSLVILDLRMPDLSGIDVFKEASKVQDHLKFVFLTGHSKSVESEDLDKEKILEIIEKPLKIDIVRKVVLDHFGE